MTLPADPVADVQRLNVNVLQACQVGLRASGAELRQARWLAENRDAIVAYNERIAIDGLTLATYWRF